jgi:hypothetical protein
LVVAYPVSDLYVQTIRASSYVLFYTVDALLDGAPVGGATGLVPTGGRITDTTKPGVRRVLNLDLAPSPGLFDALSPIGTQLKVSATVRFTDRSTVSIPMGVFEVDSEKLSEGGGGLSLTAPDKWARIQRARFILPQLSSGGMRVTAQIAALIRGALPGEDVVVTATSTATVPQLTWEKDRDKTIQELAQSIGAWVYFDRKGVATIADIPTIGASADWLVDASPSGVLIALDRERSRANTCNVVVVASSASTQSAFVPQVVWDLDVNSPTYAGVDPILNPETAGPFGIVPYFYDTAVLTSENAAKDAGLTILSRVTGLASQVSLGQTPNPALDAFDVIDVLPPRERYDIPRVLERHVADTVTHPLTVGGSTQIDGRSTRTDSYT